LTFDLDAVKMGELIALDGIKEGKYAQVICYPRYSFEELEKRLEEMRALGITALEFIGESTILNLPFLGKGCVSLVVLARTEFGKVALKIRRTDANRPRMMQEAEMLRTANSVNVGPKLIGFTENFLTMEFVDGMLLPKWVKNVVEMGATTRVRRVLQDVMEQSWRLDEIGLDHGELSHASKHIMINSEDKAYILDFETASRNRRASNVTSVSQYLFMRSEIAKTVRSNLDEFREEDLIRALRIYKKDRSRKRFEEILKICKL